MKTNRPYKCNYCEKPAVVWLEYQDYMVKRGHRIAKTLYVAACKEHEGCPNWESHLKLRPNIKTVAM